MKVHIILKFNGLGFLICGIFIYLQPYKVYIVVINFVIYIMTKAEIVSNISEKLGSDKNDVQAIVEAFMEEVKAAMEEGNNVYLRGFGSFIIKTRAEKTGRNISKNTTIKIPAHSVPSFKPAKVFVEGVKEKVKV